MYHTAEPGGAILNDIQLKSNPFCFSLLPKTTESKKKQHAKKIASTVMFIGKNKTIAGGTPKS